MNLIDMSVFKNVKDCDGIFYNEMIDVGIYEDFTYRERGTIKSVRFYSLVYLNNVETIQLKVFHRSETYYTITDHTVEEWNHFIAKRNLNIRLQNELPIKQTEKRTKL